MKEHTRQTLGDVLGALQRVGEIIIAETNEVIAQGDHIDIVRHFDVSRLAIEDIKVAREALQEMVDNLSRVVIPDAFRIAGIKTTTIIGVGRVTISNRFSCSIIDKAAGYNWLRETGNGSLIQETVNSSTLAAFAKNLMEEEGKELPAEIFKTSILPTTSITKK